MNEINGANVSVANVDETSIKCLDKGYTRLVSFGPCSISTIEEDSNNVTDLERTILQAARVSYGNDLKTYSKASNIGLLEYLISMRHTSPFEMVEFVFEIKLPLSTSVHFLRHRTANVNMVSFRYTEPEQEDFYIPDLRRQDLNRRQCSSSDKIEDDELCTIQSSMNENLKDTFKNYQRMIDMGVAREVARFYLPNSTYTRMYWKLDLHNLLHFISLRTASDAQYETRVYADVIANLITPLVPNIMMLYNKYRIESITFSSDEIEILKKMITINEKVDISSFNAMSKRKKDALLDKISKLKVNE